MKLCRFMCFAGLIFLTAAGNAFEKTKKLADAGDAEKQYEAGIMLSEGDGTAKNPDEAIRYLTMAMQNRYLPAACRLIKELAGRKNGDESAIFMQSYTLILSEGSSRSQYIQLCQDFPKRVFSYLEYLSESNYGESAEKLRQWAEIQILLHQQYFRKECDIRMRDLQSFKERMTHYLKSRNLLANRKTPKPAKRRTLGKSAGKENPRNPVFPPEVADRIVNQVSFPYQKQITPCLLYQKYPAGASAIWFKYDADSHH